MRLTLAAWALLELALRVRELVQGRGGAARDRATRVLIALAIAVAIVLATVTASRAAVGAASRAVGVIVMWLGLAVRVWSVAALGRSFRTTVEVDPGQPVVSRGPYRWIRHPSYTGLLLIVTGCGLASGSWLVVGVCFALPLSALVRRIHVEEAEMVGVLGDRYRSYQAGTKRLIPGVW